MELLLGLDQAVQSSVKTALPRTVCDSDKQQAETWQWTLHKNKCYGRLVALWEKMVIMCMWDWISRELFSEEPNSDCPLF